MNNNIRVVVLVLALLLASCAKPSIEATETCNININSQHSKAELYTQIIKEAQSQGLPGIALLIKDSEGVWAASAGYADIEEQIMMEPCHIAKVASITKLFMGTLTMQLVAEGKLELDTKINAYLDAKTLKDIANADQVTVRQLLNHTSGIYDVIQDTEFYLSILNNPPYHRKQEEVLDFVRHKPSAFAPGAASGYSNTNTLLLSMIIDKNVGDHATLLRDRIMDPLQLNNTFYYYHESFPEGRIAQGYYDLYNNGTLVNLSSYNTGSGNGYTGLYANVMDLLTFGEALFENKTLLSEAMLDTMLTFNSFMEEGSNRLLGLGVMKDFVNLGDTKIAYGHRGRDLGYSADLFYFPNQQTTLVLIVNYGTDGNSALRPAFFEMRDKIAKLITD